MAQNYSLILERDEESGNVVMILLKNMQHTGTFMAFKPTIKKEDLLLIIDSWKLFKAIPEHVNLDELKQEIEKQWPKIQLI